MQNVGSGFSAGPAAKLTLNQHLPGLRLSNRVWCERERHGLLGKVLYVFSPFIFMCNQDLNCKMKRLRQSLYICRGRRKGHG
jgi:hypothetical protein